jgi:hypothetical protein
MRCIIYDTKKGMVDEPFTTNDEGPNHAATPEGTHDLKPKPDSQMDPENQGLGNRNVENGKVRGEGGEFEFPAGTPSLTGKGHAPGSTGGNWKNLRIHNPPESKGCITTRKCGDIQRMMEENADDGGMTVKVTEVCCKKGEGPPDPAPRARPVP